MHQGFSQSFFVTRAESAASFAKENLMNLVLGRLFNRSAIFVQKSGRTLTRTMTRSNSNASLQALGEGFGRFKKKYFGQDKTLFETLQKGQAPKTVLIGCSDSRADPALLTDCDPGDIFVIRNVANLVPPHSSDDSSHGTAAAIEFAVRALKVENIIVLGHSQCGGSLCFTQESWR